MRLRAVLFDILVRRNVAQEPRQGRKRHRSWPGGARKAVRATLPAAPSPRPATVTTGTVPVVVPSSTMTRSAPRGAFPSTATRSPCRSPPSGPHLGHHAGDAAAVGAEQHHHSACLGAVPDPIVEHAVLTAPDARRAHGRATASPGINLTGRPPAPGLGGSASRRLRSSRRDAPARPDLGSPEASLPGHGPAAAGARRSRRAAGLPPGGARGCTCRRRRGGPKTPRYPVR